MKLGKDTGSLINHIIAGSNMPAPEVGMGATVLSWTDRYAATIIEIKKGKSVVRRITVRLDEAIRTDKNGMSESQTYEYKPDPNGMEMTFSLRKNGQYKLVGGGKVLAIGERAHYHDYSY